jgi:transcriptional pleiotropic repressor
MENSQRVLNKLSWSEQKSIKKLFENLDGNELFVVASKVADEVGISRSVIVNAMRNLESAGLVASRSLGIKGTYIKIIDPEFLSAVKTLEV